jgi:Tol biopolymer transport system component
MAGRPNTWVGALGLVAGCSFTPGTGGMLELPEPDAAVSLDPDAPAVLGPWRAPVPIEELNSGDGDDDPSLTADLLEIFWGSRRPGGLGLEDIWTAARSAPDQPWSEPVNVMALNSSSTETTPKVSADGLSLYFTSMRGGTGADVYVATRVARSAAWSAPTYVAALSTMFGDYSPSPSPDQRRIVLCIGPTVAGEALWAAERASTSAAWGQLARIAELDEDEVSECDPIEPHRRVIYYASNRSGKYELLVARRAADVGPYGAPEPIAELNTVGFHDRDPWVSSDERLIVFSSDRSGVDRLYLSSR